ncbi:MAG: hypothetical protein IPO50_10630 [Sphingomonadales bacterium]|nr:hypothetical protein [Sphingomonadales bacterium]
MQEHWRLTCSRKPPDGGTNARLWQWLALLQRAADDRVCPKLCKAAALAPHDASIAERRAQILLEAGLPAVDAFAAARKVAPNDGDRAGRDRSPICGRTGGDWASDPCCLVGANPLCCSAPRSGPIALDDGGGAASFASLRQAISTNPQSEVPWVQLIHALMQAELNAEALAVIAEGERQLRRPALCRQRSRHSPDSGERDAAAGLFASFENSDDPTIAVRIIRHHLRYDDVDAAAGASMDGSVDRAKHLCGPTHRFAGGCREMRALTGWKRDDGRGRPRRKA